MNMLRCAAQLCENGEKFVAFIFHYLATDTDFYTAVDEGTAQELVLREFRKNGKAPWEEQKRKKARQDSSSPGRETFNPC